MESSRMEKSSNGNTSHSAIQTKETAMAPAPHYGKRESELTLSPIEAGCSKPQSKKLRVQNAGDATTSTPKKAEQVAEPAFNKYPLEQQFWPYVIRDKAEPKDSLQGHLQCRSSNFSSMN
ncbi:uncharacterized protein LOC117169434 [Belonocnema kinseyi]|uniref:uncharacterized protein LOC117169434 n=1 Tax=Belonocnema kinseyi TaxID=2817044 RepID=UPI00143E06A7|nr:uncharacterized protein LOC117169434 [Belonocnema kinseyi]